MTDIPSNFPVVDARGGITLGWLRWMQGVQNAIAAIYSSGTTAQRPTKLLWKGRTYFDTTLGKPIWCSDPTTSPAVWVDATGAVV